MNGRTAAVVLACATGGFACSLFLDTGEFTNADAASSDADIEATPATDAPVDMGSNVDGSVTGDVDAGGDGGCPDGAFCDSFERTVLVGPWNGLTDNGKGCTLTIDNTLARDGSSSLRSFLPQQVEDGCQAFLHRQFFGSPKSFRLSFWIRVATELLREVHLLVFEVQSPQRVLYLRSLDGALELATQEFGTTPSFASDPVAGLAPGLWHRVVLEHEIATKSTTVTFDGQLRLSTQTHLSFAAPDHALLVGNTYSRAGLANDVWFDDVRLESQY